MNLSQSLMKSLFSFDCPKAIEFKYIIKPDIDTTSDAMHQGKYFEWHLLGATRDGVEPVFKPLAKGDRPQPQKDLDSLIEFAKQVFRGLNIDIKNGKPQLKLVTKKAENGFKEEGHLDLLTDDFMRPDRKCIIDVKWTATKVDDRWMGWANFETMDDQQLQARHYVHLYYKLYGVFIPFYFIVFGKSGWVRVIKANITEEGYAKHLMDIKRAKEMLSYQIKTGWQAQPGFNKCMSCPYLSICDQHSVVPEIETYHI